MSGRAALIRLDTLWRAADNLRTPAVPASFVPPTRPAARCSREPHVVTETIQQYIRQLEQEAAERAAAERAAAERAAAQKRAEEERAAAERAAAQKRAEEERAAAERADRDREAAAAAKSAATKPAEAPIQTKQEPATSSPSPPQAKPQAAVEIDLTAEMKQHLQKMKRVEAIVKSAAYSNLLNSTDVLSVVAREAHALPKKLARTMESMAVQLGKLKQVLQSSKNAGGAAGTLATKIYSAVGQCDPFAFVFVNELLSSVVKAFMNQAHQLHTIWSFSHFAALLLRDPVLKPVVEVLWVYNLAAVAGGVLLVWEPVEYVKERQHALRLYTATLVCVPDYERLWTYVASVVNDVSNCRNLGSRLHILNAVVGVAHPFLLEKYAAPYMRLAELLQKELLPELTTGSLSADEHVQLEQLRTALASKAKPDAYMLQEREKALTVE